jgi:O-antigen/teichoic acid export membrane protein
MLANLLDVSDQLVLKHFSSLPAETVDAMLGQLYAARVVPVLIVSVAGMISGSLLPYLIRDAEAHRSSKVRQRMNGVVKYAAVGFTLAAALTHVASPLLFSAILRGRYDSGLHLMPLAFAHYTWFSLAMIANKYLICIDRPRLGLLPMLLSLCISLGLNILLAPRFELMGVACATAAANALALVGSMSLAAWCGMRWDRGAWIASGLPLSLALGGGTSLAITLVVMGVSTRADWLVNADERRQLAAALRSGWTRISQRIILPHTPAA